jgi:tRNA1Val (adenine37-N6)-methyltransferase
MANHWFQFREFRIVQSHSAMKVGTDSVILGAYATPPKTGLILDIGAGTGLLSLMMAQRSDAIIHAVELNQDACRDAEANFIASPWAKQLHLHAMSIQDFLLDPISALLKFDFIVCNPPYFSQSLPSADFHRQLARHDDTLTLQDLLRVVGKVLDTNGLFQLILPFDRAQLFSHQALLSGLHEVSRLLIIPTAAKPPNRVVLSFKRNPENIISKELVVRDENGYTFAYQQLCVEYYSDDFLKKK